MISPRAWISFQVPQATSFCAHICLYYQSLIIHHFCYLYIQPFLVSSRFKIISFKIKRRGMQKANQNACWVTCERNMQPFFSGDLLPLESLRGDVSEHSLNHLLTKFLLIINPCFLCYLQMFNTYCHIVTHSCGIITLPIDFIYVSRTISHGTLRIHVLILLLVRICSRIIHEKIFYLHIIIKIILNTQKTCIQIYIMKIQVTYRVFRAEFRILGRMFSIERDTNLSPQ